MYLFTSERLGFREWNNDDVHLMTSINQDVQVMENFPSLVSFEQTKTFVERMQNQYADKGFCYFAVDALQEGDFIGFIGLSEQTFTSEFTPCIDIGWRIAFHQWNKGYAQEGARRCLEFASNDLKMDIIYAIAPLVNIKSVNVMQKIGMTKVREFEHPLLLDDERLKDCVLYKIDFRSTLDIA